MKKPDHIIRAHFHQTDTSSGNEKNTLEALKKLLDSARKRDNRIEKIQSRLVKRVIKHAKRERRKYRERLTEQGQGLIEELLVQEQELRTNCVKYAREQAIELACALTLELISDDSSLRNQFLRSKIENLLPLLGDEEGLEARCHKSNLGFLTEHLGSHIPVQEDVNLGLADFEIATKLGKVRIQLRAFLNNFLESALPRAESLLPIFQEKYFDD